MARRTPRPAFDAEPTAAARSATESAAGSEAASSVESDVARPLSPKRLAARRRRTKRILAVTITTVVLCALGGGAVFALTRGSGAEYRTATVQNGTVEQQLSLSGTVASVTRRDQAFQVGGTVNGVSVKVGDTVTAGQQLATLDTSDLQDAVDSAQDDVTSAEERLADDLETQASGGSSSSANALPDTGTTGSVPNGMTAPDAGGTGMAPGGSDPGTGDPGTGNPGTGGPDQTAIQAAVDAVTAAQQALLAQYATASAALATTQETIAASDETCRPFLEATIDEVTTGGGDGTGQGTDGTDGTDGSTDGTDTGTADPASGTDQAALDAIKADLAACQSAITEVQTEQSQVNDAQAALTPLMEQLDAAVTALQAAVAGTADAGAGTPTPAPTADAAASVSGRGSAGATIRLASSVTSLSAAPSATTPEAGSGGAGVGASTTITAETIVADQAQIDLATSKLALAQQQLAMATLTSPIAGTVAAVGLAAGDVVTSGSTTAVVSIIGDDGFVVESTVTLAKVGALAPGQEASVELPSTGTTVTGTVGSIGVLNVSEDSSTPSYQVTIALDPTDAQLLNGASAQVTVAVASQSDVLTVPTSAVHRDGADYTVDLLVDGAPQATPVEIGAMGAERTEITSGLTEGDTVVLADVAAAVPGSDTDSGGGGLTGLGGTDSTVTIVPGSGTVPSFPMGGPPTR